MKMEISRIKQKEFACAENDLQSAGKELFMALLHLMKGVRYLASGIRHLAAGIILSLVIIMALPANASGRVGAEKPAPLDSKHLMGPARKYVPGEILVKFKARTTDEIRGKINKKYDIIPAKEIVHTIKKGDTLGKLAKEHLGHVDFWKTLQDRNKIKDVLQLKIGAKIKIPSLKKSRIPRITVDHLRIPENRTVPFLVEEYKKDPNVLWAEPNYLQRKCVSPNDPYLDYQWGLDKINAPESWDVETGANSVVIAVIDTGVDYTHEDLQENIWTNSSEIPDNGIDDDGNGFVDDMQGWDFSDEDNVPLDYDGHGTHCAGIVSASGNNAIGVAGVCWNCSIMPVKIFPNAYSDVCARGIIYAVDNGARILSNSWGGDYPSNTIQAAISYANSAGAIAIFAAGNNNRVDPFYPAYWSEVVSVAATDENDEKAIFSNYGDWIDVCAPGVNIYSTLPNNAYSWETGTSMSCPFVAGLAGLLLSKNPSWTADQVRAAIENTAYFIDDANPGYAGLLGSGRIDAFEALTVVLDTSPPLGCLTTPQDEGEISTSTIITFTWTQGDAQDPESGIAGYYLQVYECRGEPPCSPDNMDDTAVVHYEGNVGDVLEYSLSGCEDGKTYYARVRAVNGAGLYSKWSGASDGITIKVCEVQPRTVEVEYTFLEPQLLAISPSPLEGEGRGEGWWRIEMEEMLRWSKPGKPVMPMRTAKILIPQGYDVQDVFVVPGASSTVEGKYKIEFGKPPTHPGLPYQEIEPDWEIYNSTAPFPGVLISTYSTHFMCGYKIAILNLFPVQYIPAEGKIYWYESLKVVVTLVSEAKPRPGVVPCRAIRNDRERVERFVDNAVETGSYLQKVMPQQDFKYVIITDESLVSAFQDLADHKASRSYDALTSTIVTTTWIYNNYDGESGDGTDDAAKIRRFIKDTAYPNWGTQYVLLGGDTDDTGDKNGGYVVPHRGCRGEVATDPVTEDDDVPCDMYFGNLDGVWDYDGDGVYGESTDGAGGGDVDLLAEVFIGRICADNATEAKNHIHKIIGHEQHWNPKKALLIGEELNKDWPPHWWGGNGLDLIYEKFYSDWERTTLYDRDGNCTKENIIAEMNSGNYHFVNHDGHSNCWYNMRLSTGDAEILTNTTYFYAATLGCYSNAFDNRDWEGNYGDDGISESFTSENSSGCFAFVGGTRYGWFIPGETPTGPGHDFNESFFDAVFKEGIRNIGKALQDSKEDLVGTVGATGSMRWEYFSLNLLGCPETPAKWGSDTTPPSGSPTPPTASCPSPPTITWTWTIGTASDESGIAGYFLQCSTDSSFWEHEKIHFSQDVDNVLTYGVADCEPGTTYYAQVRARNGCGLYSDYSGVSSGVWVEPKPDLSIDSSDIVFSHDTPEPSEVIVVSATVRNYGGGCGGINVGCQTNGAAAATAGSSQGDYVPGNANDGDSSTAWASSSDSDWLKIDLGTAKPILKVYWDAFYFVDANRPKSFTIGVSLDDVDYTTIANEPTYTEATYTKILTEPVSARYVKLDASAVSGNAITLQELEVYESAFTVKFYQGDPSEGLQIETTQYVIGLPCLGSDIFSVEWSSDTTGSYDIYVQVDQENDIDETDETNNKDHRTVTVRTDTTAPAAVNDLSASCSEVGKVDLTWSAPGDDGNSGQLISGSSYTIQYSDDSGIEWSTTTAQIKIGADGNWPGDSKSHTIEGLNGSTTYYFRLWTCDEKSHWSGQSNMASCWTLDSTPPGAITDLTGLQEGNTSVKLEWTAPGTDGYTGKADSYSVKYATFSIFHSSHTDTLTADFDGTPNQTEAISDELRLKYDSFSSTYNFTTGREIDRWFYHKNTGTDNPPSTGPDIDGEVQLGSYSKIQASDDKRTPDHTDSENGSSANAYNRHHFKFYLSQSTNIITSIAVLWEGYDTNSGSNLYIWNFNTSAWDLVGTGANTAPPDNVISGIYTSDFGNYIGPSGRVDIVATAKDGSASFWYYLYTDYVKVVVNYDCYYSSGTYSSSVKDAGTMACYEIQWTADTPSGTSLTLATRTGNTATPPTGWSDWSAESSDFSPHGVLSPDARYIQYRAKLFSNDVTTSPALSDITLKWTTWWFLADDPSEDDPAPQPRQAGSSQSMIVGGLQTQSTYYFGIRAKDNAGYVSLIDENAQEPSTQCKVYMEILDSAPPCAISNLTALTGSGSGEVELKWTAPGDDGTVGTVATYVVKYGTKQIISAEFNSAATYWHSWLNFAAGGSTETRTITGLTLETTYYFAMKGQDDVDLYGVWNSSWDVEGVNTANWCWVNVAPAAVTNLSALTNVGVDGSVKLSWTSPGDDIWENDLPSGSEFRIFHTTIPTQAEACGYQDAQIIISTGALVPGTLCSRVATGLMIETTWYFRIWTADELSNWSDISNGATCWAYISPCAISDLTGLQAIGDGHVDLEWTAPGDDGTEGTVTGYLVKFATAQISSDDFSASWVSTYDASGWKIVAGGEKSTGTVYGLTLETTYYFAIKGQDEFDNYGVWNSSADVEGTNTKNWAFPGKIIAPAGITNLSALMNGLAKVKLSWSAPGDDEWDNPLDPGSEWWIQYASYTVEWSTSSVQKTADATGTSPYTATSTCVTDFTQNATYYFRIWTHDDTQTFSKISNGATCWVKCNTAPTIEIIDQPPDSGATVQFVYKVTDPEEGQVNVSFKYYWSGGYSAGDFDGGGTISTGTLTSTTWWILTDLQAESTSQIRIYACDNAVTPSTSTKDTDIFNFDSLAPRSVEPSYPPPYAQNVSTNTSLSCTIGSDANSMNYKFIIDDDKDFGTPTAESGWESVNNWKPSLANSTTYWWKVKAKDSWGNVSSWSVLISSFVTAGVGGPQSKTYDFSTTNPGTDSWAYERTTGDFTESPPSGGTEFDSPKYTAIEASDDARAITDSGAGNDNIIAQRYLFWISEDVSSISTITVHWEGYAETNQGGKEPTLHIYNFNINNWEALQTGTAETTDQVLSSTTLNISYYIQNSSCHVKVTCPASGGGAPTGRWEKIHSDYVKVAVEWTSTANNPPTTPTGISYSPSEPATNNDITCRVRGSEDPDSGDKVIYKYKWYKDSEFAVEQSSNTQVQKPGEQWYSVTLSSDNTSENEVWYCEAWAEDDKGCVSTGTIKTSTFTIVPPAPPDTTPPAAITCLSALTSGTAGAVHLQWTSPGDDGWEGVLPTGSKYYIQRSSWTGVLWSTAAAQIQMNATGTSPYATKSTDTVLSIETTWYFRIWTADEVPNVSTGLSNGATAWALIAPAAITNLSALAGDNPDEIKLSWTAPGDDGTSGDLTGWFRINYSTVSSKQWAVGSYKIEISTENCEPGSDIERIVTGLTGGATYYFRTWTRDEHPDNWSDLSNGATCEVVTVLSVWVSTDALDFGSLSGSAVAVCGDTLTIANDGNVQVTYSLKMSTPGGWTSDPDSPGYDVYVLQSVFNTVEPSSTTFSSNDGLTSNNQTSGSSPDGKFAGDQSGKDVAIGGERNLWYLIKTPLSSKTTGQKDIGITITAEQAP